MRRKVTYDPKRDYYQLLGVGTNASADDIRQAYRRVVREAHPDLHPDQAAQATENLKLINEAYTILRQSSLRREYDSLRWAHVPGEPVAERVVDQQEPSFTSTPFHAPDMGPSRPWWEQTIPLGEDFHQFMATGVVNAPRQEVKWLRRIGLGGLETTWLMLIGLWRTPYATMLSVLSTLLSINMALIVYMAINPAGSTRLVDHVESWLAELGQSKSSDQVLPNWAANTSSRIHLNCDNTGIQIQLPADYAAVRDLALVYGTVEHDQMWNYRVRVGYVGTHFNLDSPVTSWTTVREPAPQQSVPQPPVHIPQMLALVDLRNLPMGYYVIRVEIVPRTQVVLPTCDIVVQRQ